MGQPPQRKRRECCQGFQTEHLKPWSIICGQGNERQLQKMLEYAALTVENGCIDIYNFPYAVVGELAEQRSEFLAAGWDIYTRSWNLG